MSLTSNAVNVSIASTVVSWMPSQATWATVPNSSTFFATGLLGSSENGIFPWCGTAIDPRDGKLYLHGFGHFTTPSQYSNRVLCVDLSLTTPTLTQLRGDSVVAYGSGLNLYTSQGHYADGRPVSTHTYNQMYVSTTQNRLMRFGIPAGPDGGSGLYGINTVDGFRLANSSPASNLILSGGSASYDWDPIDTWSRLPQGSSPLHNTPHMYDLTNDVAYMCTTGSTPAAGLYKWSAGTWTLLQTGDGGSGRPNLGQCNGVFDRIRNRVVIWWYSGPPGARQIASWPLVVGSTPTDITSLVNANSNAQALADLDTIWKNDGNGHMTGWYHVESLDLYLTFVGNVRPATPIVYFNPNTNQVDYWPTTGFVAPTGSNPYDSAISNRFIYSPYHKACFLYPSEANVIQVLKVG